MRRLPALLLLTTGLAAHARDGVPDPSFGAHAPGVAVIDVVPAPQISIDAAGAVVALPDGRVLVAGTSAYDFQAPDTLSVVRLGVNGTRDTAFGSGGVALLHPGDGSHLRGSVTMLRRSDGSVVVLGSGVASIGSGTTVIVACRVSADGIPDTGFGTQGCRPLPPPPGLQWNTAQSVVASLDQDNRLLVAAATSPPVFTPDWNLAVTRWNDDGSLDTTFATGGVAIVTRFDALAARPTREFVAGLAVDASGRIVVGGRSMPYDTSFQAPSSVAVARLLPDGQLDATFGDGGARLVTAPRLEVESLALAADGSPALCGTASTEADPADTDMVIVRLDAGGHLDTGFGEAGMRTIAFNAPTSGRDACHAIAIQPDGRIVVAGSTAAPGASGDLALARLWPDGRLDRGFGDRGDGRLVVAVDLASAKGNLHDQLDAVAWHGDVLTAAGVANSDYNQDEFAVLRLRADGLLDDGFD